MPVPNIQVGNDAGKPYGTKGDGFFAQDTRKLYIHDGTTWRAIGQAVGYVTLAGTVSSGEPIGYSTGWKRADADAIIPAQLIAMIDGVSGDLIPVATEMEVVSSSLTAGSPVYLSTTAGGITATRPTTGGVLKQNIGVALSTTSALLKVKPFREVTIVGQVAESTSGEAALGSIVALDSGTFEGLQTNANGEYVTYIFRLPDNLVSILKGDLRAAAESADTTFAFTVNSAVESEQWDSVTADTSLSAGAVATTGATDPIYGFDFSGALDATNIARPGALLAVKIVHANDTNANLFFGAYLVCLVTD